MVSRLWRYLFACLLLAQSQMLFAGDDPDFMLGVAGEAGQIQVKTSTRAELDKSGAMGGLKAILEMPRGISMFHFGLGFDSASIIGKDQRRDIEQSQFLQAGYLEGAWYWRLSGYVMPGFDFRAFRGPGANFSVADRKKTVMFYEGGPGFRFGLPKLFDDFDLMGQATWLVSQGGARRHVTTMLVGIGLTYPLRLPKEEVIPAPLPSAPVAEPAPEAAPEPELAEEMASAQPDAVVNPRPTSLRFERGQAGFDQSSQNRLIQLAKALQDNAENWTRLSITGHTDSAWNHLPTFGKNKAIGKKALNLQLSKKRAEAVKELMVKEGVKPDHIIVEGAGDTNLLPGLGPNAPEHRRVELNFEGIKDVKAFNQMLENIFGANAEN